MTSRLTALALVLAVAGWYAPKPRKVRTEVYPKSALTPQVGETRQACGFIVWSDSSRRLSANQVGIPLCDSLALIYTRGPVTRR